VGGDAVLAVDGLSLMRGDVTLFRDLTLSLPARTGLTLRGANGVGKTSLIRVLAGLTTPDAGVVRFMGREVAPHDARRRAALAYGGHANALKDDFTARENLAAQLALDGVVVDDDALDAALDRVGLGSRSQRDAVPTRRLSQGQKRRIGLARLSFLRTRPLWLLDEPTNALDHEGIAYFTELLTGYLSEGGAAVIATHLPLEAAGLRTFTLERAA
jgi:heme exporter protein A